MREREGWEERERGGKRERKRVASKVHVIFYVDCRCFYGILGSGSDNSTSLISTGRKAC